MSNLLTRVRVGFAGDQPRNEASVAGEETPPTTDGNDSLTFVPPDERVQVILHDYEGYTWQGHITAETGWSASKTSRILSEMETANQIVRRQVGRRKAVFLPDCIPDCVVDQHD